MGTNRHRPKHTFDPPTEEDIKAAWSVVSELDRAGLVATKARSVARCVYFVEQARELCGLHRDAPQPP
jgi:hypothetical protein